MKGKRPTASQLAERRERKRFINKGLTKVSVNSEAFKGYISFSSLSFRKPGPRTRATTFIVHTRKPIEWEEFIERVTAALAVLLV